MRDAIGPGVDGVDRVGQRPATPLPSTACSGCRSRPLVSVDLGGGNYYSPFGYYGGPGPYYRGYGYRLRGELLHWDAALLRRSAAAPLVPGRKFVSRTTPPQCRIS